MKKNKTIAVLLSVMFHIVSIGMSCSKYEIKRLWVLKRHFINILYERILKGHYDEVLAVKGFECFKPEACPNGLKDARDTL